MKYTFAEALCEFSTRTGDMRNAGEIRTRRAECSRAACPGSVSYSKSPRQPRCIRVSVLFALYASGAR